MQNNKYIYIVQLESHLTKGVNSGASERKAVPRLWASRISIVNNPVIN